jgi:hypothetical protein
MQNDSKAMCEINSDQTAYIYRDLHVAAVWDSNACLSWCDKPG